MRRSMISCALNGTPWCYVIIRYYTAYVGQRNEREEAELHLCSCKPWQERLDEKVWSVTQRGLQITSEYSRTCACSFHAASSSRPASGVQSTICPHSVCMCIVFFCVLCNWYWHYFEDDFRILLPRKRSKLSIDAHQWNRNDKEEHLCEC